MIKKVLRKKDTLTRVAIWGLLSVLFTAAFLVPAPLPGVRVGASTFGAAHGVEKAGGGSSLKDRYVMGLFSESVADNLKAKYPPSEQQWVRNIRLFVQWVAIEPQKGKFSWSKLDREIDAALSLGIDSIMLTLSGPCPKWAENPKNPSPTAYGPPKNIKDWGDFCRAVAERYTKYVDYFQIWQEPGWDIDSPPAVNDNIVYYASCCDQTYLGLLREGYNAIKAVNPNAYVASGSLIAELNGSPMDFQNYELLLDGKNQDSSVKITSDKNVVAERPMYFNYHGVWPGGHVEVGAEKPGKLWYLAEGATHPGFEEWICIQNPRDKKANVTITYMFPGGVTKQQSVTISPESRYTVGVNDVVGPNKDVAAKVESDQDVVVERPMYFNYHGAWRGGSVEMGTKELSNEWYLAEGATHPGFEEWISFMNPGNEKTQVEVTYMMGDGSTQKQSFSMAPTSRETILVNQVVGANKDVSAKVSSSKPILVERPMYFLYHGAWDGGHSETAAPQPSTSWFLAEGTTRCNQQDGSFEEWISIMNPGEVKANIDVTYMFPGGETSESKVEVLPRSRGTIFVNGMVQNRDVSVKLSSDQPIVVERPMYYLYHNAWSGGSVELGSQGASKEIYFAEGSTRIGFEEWITLQNPNDAQASATLEFMMSDGSVQKETVSLPANSRTTVDVGRALSLGKICDGVAVHPYHYPNSWGWYVAYLRGVCRNHGFSDLEVLVSEIGWPHATDRPSGGFSPEEQRRAIGEVGVGGIIREGCKKIWIYLDVDQPPGTSWDGIYNGLFDYYGNPMPAWGEYKKWQTQFPDYPNKPSGLWE
ncbi:MAG: beta-galactosidase [Actinomycetota bacterium]|nr:beta-galactosidase [Actinomycetota bacterium]